MFPWIFTVIIPNVVFAPFWDYDPITDWSRDLATTTAKMMTSATQAMLAAQQNFALTAIGMNPIGIMNKDVVSYLAASKIPQFDVTRQRGATFATTTKW